MQYFVFYEEKKVWSNIRESKLTFIQLFYETGKIKNDDTNSCSCLRTYIHSELLSDSQKCEKRWKDERERKLRESKNRIRWAAVRGLEKYSFADTRGEEEKQDEEAEQGWMIQSDCHIIVPFRNRETENVTEGRFVTYIMHCKQYVYLCLFIRVYKWPY